MKKKISLGVTIAIAAIVAAVAFSGAYMLAMNNFNSKVSDLAQRQAVFSKLSEVDTAVRQNYSGDIDEDKLMQAIIDGYITGLDTDKVIYVPADKYEDGKYSEKDYKTIKLTDGSAVVIAIDYTSTVDEAK